MSTKIYNAYRVVNSNLGDVVARINELAPDLKEALNQKFKEMYMVDFIENLDFKGFSKEASDRMARHNTSKFFERKECESCVAFGSLSVLLKSYQGCVYLLFYSNNESLRKVLEEKIEGIEDFSYWNNSDEPEHISEEEWMVRGETWDKVIPSGSPLNDGFVCWEFNGDQSLSRQFKRMGFHDCFDENYLPSKEQRAELYAHHFTAKLIRKDAEGKSLAKYMDEIRAHRNREILQDEFNEAKQKFLDSGALFT